MVTSIIIKAKSQVKSGAVRKGSSTSTQSRFDKISIEFYLCPVGPPAADVI